MNKKYKRKQCARNEPASTPEEIKFVREAIETMKKVFPWLCAKPEAQLVAYRATFPRSIAGNRQDDQLLRKIYHTWQHYRQDVQLARLQIVEMVSSHVAMKEDSNIEGLGDEHPGSLSSPASELAKLVSEVARLSRGQSFQPKTDTEFFSRIAGDLNYLETHKPTAGDYAVEALQDAFVGLMQSTYAWGQKGYPTKGEVREMAKAILKRQGKSKKSGWTELLRTADLGWLPEGAAGRPASLEVDRNLKAKQEFLSKQTQYVNEVLGGDWSLLNHKAGHVFGGKQLAQQHETERLKQYGRQELSPDEEESE
jgi:hypothetical protein